MAGRIDGAGHTPQDEQTAEVIGVLRTFLAAKAAPSVEIGAGKGRCDNDG